MNLEQRLALYRDDLLRFNRVQNLVSRVDPEMEIARLFEECLAAARGLDPFEGPLLDVGSGAGFPGLIFAAVHDQVEITLLERRRGRCDFLERCVQRLGLHHVEVQCGDLSVLNGRTYPWITGKAVKDPARFLELVDVAVRSGSRVALFQRADSEVEGTLPPEYRVEASFGLGIDQGVSERWLYVVRRASDA